jgi:CDP-6-deoxy-D-xylo-4-hexulose-3-dehydrase
VAPIIQFGAVPVFVDVTIPQYSIDIKMLEKALSKKTKAVMLAHTLGNPFDIKAVKTFCKKNDLWLIEDNCDSLGSKYKDAGKWKYTGSFGDISTSSFYPPHHMTTGEGGAVYTSDPLLYKIAASLRDWGRDCRCASGQDNLCGHRFDGQFGELPEGYDHKYVYSHFGYNLKATDMQAAIGCSQLEKLPGFIKKRKNNWKYLKAGLSALSEWLILPEPAKNSDPSWFGFLLTIREGSGLSRARIVSHLESKGIQTRMLFAGNIIRHPCFDDMRRNRKGYRVAGALKNTDMIMNNTFWVGVYPGMNDKMLENIIGEIFDACGANKRARKC